MVKYCSQIRNNNFDDYYGEDFPETHNLTTKYLISNCFPRFRPFVKRTEHAVIIKYAVIISL